MISFQKLVSPLRRLFDRNQREEYVPLPSPGEDAAHPWQRNLDSLANRTPEVHDVVSATTDVEAQFMALMEQARLEKLKLEAERGLNHAPKRKTDATVTDAKAWWGQAVATWEPADAKNVDSFAERRHPRSSK